MSEEKNKHTEVNLSMDANTTNAQKSAIKKTYDAYTNLDVVFDENGKPKPKRIVFEDIKSLSDLKPEVQDKIRKLASIISEDKIRKLVNDIENERELFVSNERSIFGKTTDAEKLTIEKKLEQLKVPDEINKTNIAAIVSCLDNILVEID